MRYTYKMFGYNVESEIKMDFAESDFSVADIQIVIDDKTYINPLEEEQKWEVFFNDDRSELIFYDVGSFLVEKGRIVFRPLASYDERAVILYITGFMFGVYMLMQNRCALHGSVIKIGDQAIVFSGESGSGKSSIARGFIEKGYQLLSDDLALINGDHFVIPSFPSQKLWDDTAAMFDLITDSNLKTCVDDEKFYMPIEHEFYQEPLCIGALFIIKKDGHDVEIEKPDAATSLSYVMKNTYLDYMMEEFGKKQLHFRFSVELAAKIPVYVIHRKDGINSIDRQIELVLETLQSMNKL